MTNEPNAPVDKKSKVIVAIDDDAVILALIGKVVSSGGYTFFGASGGEEGITLLERIIPRLILLDVQMPGVDGFAVCRRLRNLPRMRQVPIAFLTARKTTEDVRTGMAAGGNDFIIKPFEPEKLLARIHHWTTRQIG